MRNFVGFRGWPRRAARRIGLLAATSLLVAGCYSYEAPAGSTPAPGMAVSVELTDMGTAQLGRLLGMGVREVEGTLVRATDSALTLAVRTVRQRNGIESYWKGEEVTLDRAMLAGVRERRLSWKRTALAGGAAVGGAAVAAGAFSGGGKTGSGSGTHGGGHPTRRSP